MSIDIDARRTIRHWGDWDEMRRDFRWQIPARFNIAEACCASWAREEPERIALTHVPEEGPRQDWTYAALDDAAARLAASLAARGVGPGDRVAVLLGQGPETLISHFAALRLGAISVPLFTLFGPEALAFRLADSGARALISQSAALPKLAPILPQLDQLTAIWLTDGAPAPHLDFWAEIEAHAPIPAHETAADDPAVMIYTSGTTGPPKGALHAHRFLIGHLPAVECHLERFPQEGDVGWTPADWAWIGGLMDLAMPCLYFGARLVSHRMRKFDPTRAFTLMRDEGVCVAFLPPTALKLMRTVPVPEGLGLRAISSGGESLSADLIAWGRQALGAPINEIYGQTECNLVISTAAGAMEVRPGTMGKPVPGHEVAILGPEGTPLAPGEVGQIAVRAPDPVMFLGYWNQPEKTRAKFLGDWLLTGDLGREDPDGYVTYVARDDDLITSAGYRIGPTEIENCLAADPDVLMAAVVGIPDPLRTQIVKAFVVPRPGAETQGLADRLTARVRTELSPHLAPREVEFVDSLPMTATGKIMRRALREP